MSTSTDYSSLRKAIADYSERTGIPYSRIAVAIGLTKSRELHRFMDGYSNSEAVAQLLYLYLQKNGDIPTVDESTLRHAVGKLPDAVARFCLSAQGPFNILQPAAHMVGHEVKDFAGRRIGFAAVMQDQPQPRPEEPRPEPADRSADRKGQVSIHESDDDIRTAVNRHMEDKKVSYRELERATGISASAINQWLKGIYKGNGDKVKTALKNYLSLMAERAANSPLEEVPFVQTMSARRAIATIRFAHVEREMGLVVAKSGYGKTRVITEYVRQNKSTIFVEVAPFYNTRILLAKICDRLNLPTGRVETMYDAIIEKVRDSDRLIVIDEAEYLPVKALETIRRIHDHARIGIVLVGLERLKHNLEGAKREHEQLYNRQGRYCKMDEVNNNDSSSIVRAVFPDADDTHCAACFDNSRRNIRRLVKLCKRIKAVMRGHRLKTINAMPIDKIAEIAETQLI